MNAALASTTATTMRTITARRLILSEGTVSPFREGHTPIDTRAIKPKRDWPPVGTTKPWLPISRECGPMRWRGPESNWRHHDFQGAQTCPANRQKPHEHAVPATCSVVMVLADSRRSGRV